jgi:hypothetical protein
MELNPNNSGLTAKEGKKKPGQLDHYGKTCQNMWLATMRACDASMQMVSIGGLVNRRRRVRVGLRPVLQDGSSVISTVS